MPVFNPQGERGKKKKKEKEKGPRREGKASTVTEGEKRGRGVLKTKRAQTLRRRGKKR